MRQSPIAALTFRALVEIGALSPSWRRLLGRTARHLVGAFLFVALVDLNTTHVRDVVRGLVASWEEAQTNHKMGAVAAALDAEYATYERYPPPDAFHEFVRGWIDDPHGDDPARDHWGSLLTLSVDGVHYEIRSCGRDAVCDTADDLHRRSSY